MADPTLDELARENENLRRELAAKDARLRALVDNDAADRIVALLKGRYAAIGIIAATLGTLVAALAGQGILTYTARGVFKEERDAFHGEVAQAASAAASAEALGTLLASRERRLSQKAQEAEEVIERVKLEATDLADDLSRVRGDVQRTSALSDERLSTLEAQVKALAAAGPDPQRKTIEALTQTVEDKRRAFARNADRRVELIHHFASSAARRKAEELQAALSALGYKPVLKSSDFSEVRSRKRPGTRTLVARSSAERDAFAKEAGLTDGEKWPPDPALPVDFQVLLF